VGKMMLGQDYPHHEGTVHSGTSRYLQATLGAAGVPQHEARMMLGDTAAAVFGFDPTALAPVTARLAVGVDDVLMPPEEDFFPRGDVNKPFV
jgi:hypothetical protein